MTEFVSELVEIRYLFSIITNFSVQAMGAKVFRRQTQFSS